MSEEGKCQFCGASRDSEIMFKCGTLENDPEPRTRICWIVCVINLKEKLAQQAQEVDDKDKRLDFGKRISESLKAQLKYADERLEAWRKTRVGWDEYWESLSPPELVKLKDLGEI